MGPEIVTQVVDSLPSKECIQTPVPHTHTHTHTLIMDWETFYEKGQIVNSLGSILVQKQPQIIFIQMNLAVFL
jgi:hypothetical protein